MSLLVLKHRVFGYPHFRQLSLVGGIPTSLKNMSSSVGMIIPNIWKNKNVPNHQSVMYNVPFHVVNVVNIPFSSMDHKMIKGYTVTLFSCTNIVLLGGACQK